MRGRLEGEVVAVGLKRPQGRKLRWQLGGEELEDPLRPEEVLQVPLTEVHQARAQRKLIAHQLLGRQREQRLAPVTSRQEPSYPVHGGAEVVSLALLRSAGVQCHPHPQGACLLPLLVKERSLNLKSGVEGVRGHPEGAAEGITDSLEDVATTLLMARLSISSWRANAACMACGLLSHILVEPSMSVNRKVTVPVGGLVATTLISSLLP